MNNMRRILLTVALLGFSPDSSSTFLIRDDDNKVKILQETVKPMTAFSPTFIDPKLVSENKISKKNSRYINSNDSSKELTCLANNIYFEASGESRKGKIAVANVTMKRLKQKRHKKSKKPETVCGVVFAHNHRACAFSWTCDRYSNIPPYDEQSYSDSKEIAKLALSGNLPDVTGGADFYHAKYVRPKWANKMRITTVIGGHIFYNSGTKV